MSDINEMVKAIVAAPSCCPELRITANAWLNAGTDDKKAAADALVAELKDDVMPVDAVISFFGTDAARNHFGAATAYALLKGAQEHKAAGGKYCNCPACSAGAAVLEQKELLYK